MRTEVLESIESISEAWDRVAPRDCVALESRHLLAIERSGINAIRPYYILAREGDEPVGIAHCFLMDLDLKFVEKDLSPETIRTLRAWHSNFMKARVLECGFVSSLGEAIAARDGSRAAVCRLAASEMERIGREAGAEILLIRDVPYDHYSDYAHLTQEGFRPLLGFPLATMQLRWRSMDEYMQALKATSRWRIRHTLGQRSAGLVSEVIPSFGQHAARLVELWRQTHGRATDYSHEELNEAYFREIDRQLGDRSQIVVLKRHDRIVAFSLCLLGDGEFFSSHAGLDYTEAGDDNLHFCLSMAVLEDALRKGARTINRGITTYDVKFALGFEAQPQIYLIKHLANPRLTASVARRLADAMPQPENAHRPFRGQDVSERIDLKSLAQRLTGPSGPPDVFAKVDAYDRANSARLGGVYAYFPPFEGAQGPTIQHHGREVVMLGANAYLGLATHPALAAAAKAAIEKYGTGSSGSPLLNGTLDIHADLARALADFMQKDDVLLCSTGYQTNVGVVSALLAKDDIVIMDRLNHASLVDGARMAGAEIVRFRHNDMESLEQVLKRYPDRGKFVVVDSVYSMEGAIADLPTIVELARKYGARTMVDEAHALGVLGPGGRGAAEQLGVLDKVDIVMGSLSKALAAVGGFVAAEARVIDYLRHVARSHIFSTSLPPPAIATARAALEIIKNEPERRRTLLHNAEYMSQHLEALGYDAPYRHTAIVPVHCGNEVVAMGAFKWMLSKGVFVNPVLQPAVPKGRELLRTSYMATHTEEMLDRAVAVFAAARSATFPARRAIAVPHAKEAVPLRVRPMIFLPVADRSALSDYYVPQSAYRRLRVPGFTRLEIGQAVDCAISFGSEGVILQSQGMVVSKCPAPKADGAPGIEVELGPNESRVREIVQAVVEGGDARLDRRQSWRYHADIDVDLSSGGSTRAGMVDDISLEGAAIRSHPAPACGTRVALRLKAPCCAPIDVSGAVRWRRDGDESGFGLQFLFGSESERESIQTLIGTIRTASAETASAAISA